MMRTPALVLISVALTGVGCRSAEESPYVGLEQRSIKALAPQDIHAYLDGEGMGYALAAELNGHPGPKHALELARELDLSDTQRTEIERLYEVMADSAKQLGRTIVDLESTLDTRFAARDLDSTTLRAIVGEIAALEGDLRFTHLAAHLAMTHILTPMQVADYDRLRGYGNGGDHIHQPGSHTPTPDSE